MCFPSFFSPPTTFCCSSSFPVFKLQLQLLANVIIKNTPLSHACVCVCVCVKLAIILTSSVHMYLYELCIICCCFGTSDGGVNGIVLLRRRLGVVVVVVVRVMMVIMLLLLRMVMTHMLLLCYSWLLLCWAVAVVVVILLLVRVVLVIHQTLGKGKRKRGKGGSVNIDCWWHLAYRFGSTLFVPVSVEYLFFVKGTWSTFVVVCSQLPTWTTLSSTSINNK